MNNGVYYNKSASIPKRERSQPAKRFVSFICILLFALSLLRAEKEPSFAYLFNGSRTTLRECCGGRESHHHPMFGSVVGSFMRILLGIPRSLAEMEGGLLVAPYVPRDIGMGCGLYPNALGTAVGGVEAQRSGGAGQHRGAPSIWRSVLAAGRWKNGDHDHGVIRYRRTV